jgi:hypothetical protein
MVADMIHDVDASLMELLRAEALNGGEADVVFDAPTKEWVSRQNTPAVDAFLYDIREDVSRRDVMAQPVRNDQGVVVGRRPPVRRFKLAYLLTAWTRRPEDEHRLLSQLLTALLGHDRIPERYLQGQLSGEPTPVLLQLALPPTQDRSLSDIWNALGGELKPSIDLVVIAPLDPARRFEAGPPVEERTLQVVRTDRRHRTGQADGQGPGRRRAGRVEER